MKRSGSTISATAIALPGALLLLALSSCSTLPSRAPGIDPEASAIMRDASATLAAAESFSFRIQRDVPSVIAEAAGMREKADIRVSAQRPNKVMAVDQSGDHVRCFYYDGSQITRHGGPGGSHAIADAPATTDEMITFLNEQWGVHPPLAGLLHSKPFDSAIQNARSGSLVGDEMIDGETCHHIKFDGDGVVWDLWFSADDHLPRRFDVTVTDLSGAPRGRTIISEWNLDAKFPADHFHASIPEGSTLREMEELLR